MRSVPGIAWWPGTIAAGSVTDALASTMDMFVTAVELAGGQLPTDRTYDGRSLVPLLMGKAPPRPWRTHFMTEFAEGGNQEWCEKHKLLRRFSL